MQKTIDLNILFENMTEGVTLRDQHLNILQCNPAAHEILGIPKDESKNRAPFDSKWKMIREDGSDFPQDEHPAVIALKTGIIQKQVVMGIRKPNGELRWTSGSAVPIFDGSNPVPIRVISTSRDITEEKKLINELKKSESKFKTFFEHAPLGIVQLDPDRRYLEANQAFQNMVGYTMEELRKTTMFALTHPEDLHESRKRSENFDQKDFSIKNLKKRYLAKNGKIVWGKVSSRSLENADKNQSQHLVTIIEDITEQKEMEENLRATEIKLMESAKMSALGEMAAGMAHEINNPLSIISAYSAVIRKRIDKEPSTDNLENIRDKLFQIENTVERIAKIVRGLKAFSRNSDLDAKNPVLVSQIIQDTLILCQEKFKAKLIDVKLNITSDPLLNCRPSQLIQVLMNLLNNAHDAIHAKNSSWIEIATKIEKNTLLIMVTDSGNGISLTIQEKMMLPFFTTKEVGKGTGLGLSIAKGIIEEHDGRLYFDRSSKNTRFTIELPL